MTRVIARRQTRQNPTGLRVNMRQSISGRNSPVASYDAPSNAPTLAELCVMPASVRCVALHLRV